MLSRLHAAGLGDDVVQLLDALWLAASVPAARSDPTAAAHEPPQAATGAAALRLPMMRVAAGAGTLPQATVELRGKAPAAQDAGLYAPTAQHEAAHDDALRARPVRVVGVAALRDAGAMARALRPLGKRRPSRTRFDLDEAATAEHYAETGLLVPRWVAQRERFFAATLIVEDTPALPLWRTLAGELEDLLARQGGFRSFRRYTLAEQQGELRLRSRSGAWSAPRVLRDDDATLVLLATDGTSPAWSDGRMAALIQALGEHTSLALLQWLPERRWPHTALGAADLQAWLPRAGAPNAELAVQRPRWLSHKERIVPVPLAALTPASFARLAAMLMAKPGQRAAAAMLWPAGSEFDVDPVVGEVDDGEPSAAQRIVRFRSVAGARVLQAAVHLSAAAPLTLPVVRLVHHVMQPDAPSEDLPLLLLGGLLERRRSAGDDDSDDRIEFDFAPGVRALLQRSLTSSEAAEVRRAVSRHIAERSGSTRDFAALLLDPAGTVLLPAWARPFAEVSRQVQQLFAPREAPAALLATVQERQWSPGVTVQAEIELPGQVRQMQWSRDGQRLAVLHEYGLQVLRLIELGPGRRQWQREPLAMRAPVHLLFVKGYDIDEAAAEALIARVRNEWSAHFRHELAAQYHTVADVHRRNPQRSARADVQQLTKLIRKPRALVCCIGGPSFFASGWLREAMAQWAGLFESDPRPPMLAVVGDNPAGSGSGAWRVHRLLPTTLLGKVSGRADAAGSLLLALLRDLGAQALAEVAFGADASGIAWDHQDRLLVADARLGSVMREDTLEQVYNFTESFAKGQPVLMAAHQSAPLLALAGHGQVLVFASGGPRPAQTAAGEKVEALAWSSEGDVLAWRFASGEMSELPFDVTGAVSFARRVVARQCAAGPAWSRRGERLAYGLDDGTILIEAIDSSQQIVRRVPPLEAVDWSHDDRWLAIARQGGRITLVADPNSESIRELDTAVPEPEEGASTTLAFVPRGLDEGYEALAVVQGNRLTLLRVAAAAFQAVATPPSPRDPPAPWATPEEVTDAAREVLHSMALAFHVGRLLPGEGFASRVYGEALGIAPDSEDGRSLAQVASFTEWLFHDTVKRVLTNRDDPIARPDLARGQAVWRDTCEAALRQVVALIEYVQGGPPRGVTLGGSTALNDVIEHWRWAHGLWAADGRADDGPGGWLSVVGVDYAKMMALMERLASESLPRQAQLELLSAVSSAISAMPANPVADAFVAQLSRRAWLTAVRGASAFTDCRRFDDYLDRFIEHWSRYAEQLKRLTPDTGDRLELGFAAPLPSLKRIESLFEALKFGIEIEPTESDTRDGVPRHEWSLPRSSYAPLVQMLGAIITTQVAKRLGGPVPLAWGVPGSTLLWVDDKPDNNRRECEAFNRRGFRMLLADNTDGALQAMDAEHVDAVISDMSRPGDRRAGYTLLGRLRKRGSGVPFLLYTTPVILAELGDSPLPGPTVTTDQFQELEAALRSLFTTPAAA